jgi:pimeloyl-[acyl-carrier protein] synthase
MNSLFAALTPELLADPYSLYRTLHATDPVLRADGAFGLGAWLVTSHSVCSSALKSKSFIKEGNRVLPPEKLAAIPQESPEMTERRKSNLLFRDPPVHTRLRGLVNQAFTPRTVESLRPHIAEVAEQLLDEARGPRIDLIREFAFPLPIIVIAELLGVPPGDRDRFKAWSTDMTLALSPTATAEELERTKRAIDAMDEYMRVIIEERRAQPRADLISQLVHAQEAGDQLSIEELLATCRLLLTAGHETTVNLIGNGTLALLRHDEQRARLVKDPSLLPNAVEELLRYDSPVQMTLRFALDRAPLGHHTVERGDVVLLLIGGANRDPEQYAEPDRLDLGRANAQTHLAFGAGIHYCLGASLARLEGELALGALLRRWPTLSLAPEPLVWRRNPVLRGLQALPLMV